jgi:hypothetical protein
MLRRFVAGAAVAVLALTAGCSGGRKLVPVSGTVTVDGQPAKGVVVSFQPLGDKSDENPGRGSSAYTDESGHYTLIYDGEKPGALTGKHRIRISPQWVTNKEGGGPALNYPIPPEWHDMSKQEYEVPANGTDQANFSIDTGAKK